MPFSIAGLTVNNPKACRDSNHLDWRTPKRLGADTVAPTESVATNRDAFRRQDRVEISDEARKIANEISWRGRGFSAQQLTSIDDVDQRPEWLKQWQEEMKAGDAPKAKVSATAPSAAASDAEKDESSEAARALLEKLNTVAAGLNKQIAAVLEKNDLKLSANERLRIEVNADGKIFVGGIKDAAQVNAIEKALNAEDGLGAQINDYKKDYQEASGILEKIAGKGLSQLTRDPGGATNFLRDNPEIGKLIKKLAADNALSTGSILTNPEGALKDLLTAARGKIQSAFGEYNDDLFDKMRKNHIPLGDNFNRDFMLDLHSLAVSFTNAGEREISVGGDKRTAANGEAIVKKILDEVLRTTDATGEVEIFTAATERLLLNYENVFGEPAGDDTRINLQLEAGWGAVGISSPAKEKEIAENISQESNRLLRRLGAEFDEPLAVEVDDQGKLRVTNLPTGAAQRQSILSALAIINTQMENEGGGNDEYAALRDLRKQRQIFQRGGIGGLNQINADRSL
ncbi:MAG: hypothetical protein LBP75_07870 [Planctomycetota bacterium]|jgi:biopolymer transport protein ExbD|nr:hypothetical protein [Planctomycetota bacterium]